MCPRTSSPIVSDYSTVLLSTILSRTILVGAILVVIQYAHEGIYGLMAAMALPLLVFGYLTFGDAAILR